jgi:hypothetical protein
MPHDMQYDPTRLLADLMGGEPRVTHLHLQSPDLADARVPATEQDPQRELRIRNLQAHLPNRDLRVRLVRGATTEQDTLWLERAERSVSLEGEPRVQSFSRDLLANLKMATMLTMLQGKEPDDMLKEEMLLANVFPRGEGPSTGIDLNVLDVIFVISMIHLSVSGRNAGSELMDLMGQMMGLLDGDMEYTLQMEDDEDA